MKMQLSLFLQRFPLALLKQHGTECPWCGRDCKAYGYDLDKPHIDRAFKILSWCYNRKVSTFNSKDVFDGYDTQFPRLQYWGIIEYAGRRNTWKLTKLGERFLSGHASLPNKVWVYDATVIDRSETLVRVEDVEPRWKTEYSHWALDYILYPQSNWKQYA